MHIIKHAKLQTTVFIGKTNLQMDLDPQKRKGMRLLADDESQTLYVDFNGEIGRVPYTDIVSMIPENQSLFRKVFDHEYEQLKITTFPTVASIEPMDLPKKGRPKAQASSPMDHVHAGLGAGKTHD